jgi:hypothetical protein
MSTFGLVALAAAAVSACLLPGCVELGLERSWCRS